ncbi:MULTISPECIES: formate dehydrogenase accessory sulfurtransferase FdhD [Thermomonosporaceae]|uniref:formate dehydrogenase accessory sulfurtransferase FdhD n=1 Tax=Thermomonosporaceae TaxID=2012 RepID=UPI00255AF7AC|nr:MULTISPECIES: formate dehydrogenase accessory sulfurtransferase FdhD [Thermomonosporaceae]MDL4777090.1 formate dehydrogenase accessory sulfurtransferase FdhD [Actinomadura xylanilytica]
MGRITVRRPVLRLSTTGTRGRRPDTLAVEEPLEIRIDGRPLTITMRTPGADFDLAAGFLAAEGIIGAAGDLAAMRYCADTAEQNTLDVVLAPGVRPPDALLTRAFTTTSACGVCGKSSIEALRTDRPYDVAADTVALTTAVLAALPDRLRESQRVFDRTGGLHAAGLFDADGGLLVVREDVGRHNAVDKVVGWALRQDLLPLTGRILMVSGRASFELTQKAAQAGIPVLAAVSAPSSLAVELAEDAGMTLVGFLRGETMNVYTGADRIPC